MIGIHLVDETVEVVAIGKVTAIASEGATARRDRSLDCAAIRFQIRADGDDVGARFRQSKRHRLADAAARPGD